MTGMPETIGRYIARARKAAGLTLRAVAEKMGVSVPFLHDVENDRRKMTSARWAALAAALPGVTVRGLAEAAFASGPVEVDARILTPSQRAALVDALAQEVEAAAKAA